MVKRKSLPASNGAFRVRVLVEAIEKRSAVSFQPEAMSERALLRSREAVTACRRGRSPRTRIHMISSREAATASPTRFAKATPSQRLDATPSVAASRLGCIGIVDLGLTPKATCCHRFAVVSERMQRTQTTIVDSRKGLPMGAGHRLEAGWG